MKSEAALAGACLRPLGHLSKTGWYMNIMSQCKGFLRPKPIFPGMASCRFMRNGAGTNRGHAARCVQTSYNRFYFGSR